MSAPSSVEVGESDERPTGGGAAASGWLGSGWFGGAASNGDLVVALVVFVGVAVLAHGMPDAAGVSGHACCSVAAAGLVRFATLAVSADGGGGCRRSCGDL